MQLSARHRLASSLIPPAVPRIGAELRPASVPPHDAYASPSSSEAIPDEVLRRSVPLRAPHEPANLHGMVFERTTDGRLRILAGSGQTQPDVMPGGQPNIPADAVKDNRVVFFVDGIQNSFANQVDKIKTLFQAPEVPGDYGCDVGQSVIAVHEGVGKNVGADVKRIAFDWTMLKALQTPFVKPEKLRETIYRHDPAVKALHDEVRQCLQVGRQVTIAGHSGGGMVAALALTLLAKEEDHRYQQAVTENVRLLELSPAAAVKDYEKAGIKPENLYQTGSKRDPLWKFARHFIHPICWPCNLPAIAGGIAALVSLLRDRSTPYHDPDYIFWKNMAADGSQPIQAFLDGGPGAYRPLP